ncbi:hypothetical protein [Nocardia fusca]|uniref:hypothetical protein n=1 Tax=Nocardia fusca TaxID=941183 RepID=UPI0007A763CC|nr:hypothetical protein [Nocardia fusca]
MHRRGNRRAAASGSAQWDRALLVGPDAGLGDRARAIVALGGLSDCLVLLADTPVEELRVAALDRRPPAADSAASAR